MTEVTSAHPEIRVLADRARELGATILRTQFGAWLALASDSIKTKRKRALSPHLAFEDPHEIDRYPETALMAIDAFYAEAAAELPGGVVIKPRSKY